MPIDLNPPQQPDNRARFLAQRATWVGLVVGLLIILPVEFLRLQEATHSNTGWLGWFTSLNLDTTLPLLVYLCLPLCWAIFRGKSSKPKPSPKWLETWFGSKTKPHVETRLAGCFRALLLAGIVAGTSWGISALVGASQISLEPHFKEKIALKELPPALHDEYSYLFQAQTFLAGRVAFPIAENLPGLFDQMHVLNDNGIFASRYFPGTGLWMMPFVALEKPYWGHWFAGSLCAAFVFLIGRELGGNSVGLVAGLLTAVSPGVLTFGQLLLAHHPTLVGLTFFVWMFLRMMRTCSYSNAILAGIGLAFAMLCRPMTAASVGLPFGLWLLYWWMKGSKNEAWNIKRRSLLLASLGLPLFLGIGSILVYNTKLTGNPWVMPYQLYTDIYTPRHVFGFNNVERAKGNTSTKIIENYDNWAINLTPALAWKNEKQRILASGQWVFGVIPLAISLAVFLFVAGREPASTAMADRRWWLVFLAILSLHLAHVPYWFAGIRHWHYVFESAPFLLLILAGVTCYFLNHWQQRQCLWFRMWWYGLLVSSLFVGYGSLPGYWDISRVQSAIQQDVFAKRKYAIFTTVLDRVIPERPALVLVAEDQSERHIDYITNHPSLNTPIIRGRFRPENIPLQQVLTAFPNRKVYLAVLDPKVRENIHRSRYEGVRFQVLTQAPFAVYQVVSEHKSIPKMTQ